MDFAHQFTKGVLRNLNSFGTMKNCTQKAKWSYIFFSKPQKVVQFDCTDKTWSYRVVREVQIKVVPYFPTENKRFYEVFEKIELGIFAWVLFAKKDV